MQITYTPEGSTDRQTWSFDHGRVRASAAEMIEKRFGDNWDAFVAGVQSGNMRARRVLLWHLMTQAHPGLKFEDVPDFFADEVKVEFTTAELTAIRARMEKAKVAEDVRERTLAAIDTELAEAAVREGAAPEPGKAN